MNDVRHVQNLCSQLDLALHQYRSIESRPIRDRIAQRVAALRDELIVLGHLPRRVIAQTTRGTVGTLS